VGLSSFDFRTVAPHLVREVVWDVVSVRLLCPLLPCDFVTYFVSGMLPWDVASACLAWCLNWSKMLCLPFVFASRPCQALFLSNLFFECIKTIACVYRTHCHELKIAIWFVPKDKRGDEVGLATGRFPTNFWMQNYHCLITYISKWCGTTRNHRQKLLKFMLASCGSRNQSFDLAYHMERGTTVNGQRSTLYAPLGSLLQIHERLQNSNNSTPCHKSSSFAATFHEDNF